jgi:triacylglycerol lipase
MADDREQLGGEWRVFGEWARLLSDPIYRGLGVPRGDGRLVLVLPGLFGNDIYLQPLRAWLFRIGYHPVRSTLSVNAGCYERLTRQAQKQLQTEMNYRRGRVALIGHSRGGMLARAIAARLQDQASHLVLLGSPVGALLSMSQEDFDRGVAPPGNRVIADASLWARRLLDPDCTFPGCGCPFPADFRQPLSLRTLVLSVHTRDDVVVHPSAGPVPGARNVEVGGTHSGLVYNRTAYQELATTLATDQ